MKVQKLKGSKTLKDKYFKTYYLTWTKAESNMSDYLKKKSIRKWILSKYPDSEGQLKRIVRQYQRPHLVAEFDADTQCKFLFVEYVDQKS